MVGPQLDVVLTVKDKLITGREDVQLLNIYMLSALHPGLKNDEMTFSI